MSKYRVEWKMGGEMIFDFPEGDAPPWLDDFVLKALDNKAADVGDDIADDAGVDILSSDGTAEMTFTKLT